MFLLATSPQVARSKEKWLFLQARRICLWILGINYERVQIMDFIGLMEHFL